MRKLATIRQISDIREIQGADAIELAIIDGWQTVVKKSEFKAGEMVVFCEIDSWIPHDLAPFLSKGKEPREYQGIKGERLRSAKIRGQLSQGLVLPINGIEFSAIGDDVSDILGIVKWEREIPAQLRGQAKGNFPSFLRKTDQERVQNLVREIERIRESGEPEMFEVSIKLDGCFGYRTYLPTWGGSSVMIGDIVTKGLRPTLIGKNDHGDLVPCEITNVFNNGTKDHWIDINFIPPMTARMAGKSGRLRVTPNHKVFLASGQEIDAGNVKPGDSMISYITTPDDAGLHFIRSSLLGDGCISTKHGRGWRFEECHTKNGGIEYTNYVRECLGDLYCATSERKSGYGSSMISVSSKQYATLESLKLEWYSNGKAIIPSNLEWIDDFSVAKWYMDDGSLSHSDQQNDRAVFNTNAYSADDAQRLREKLESMYGISSSLQNNKGIVIRINYGDGSIHSFWRAIAPHIHPSMRYKLPAEYRGVEFVPYKPCKEVIKPISVQVVSVEQVDVNKKNFPNGRTGFDIETTTHNYVCGGLLVHNSSFTAYHNNGATGFCSRNLELKPEDEGSVYAQVFRKYHLADALAATGMNVAIQGEIMGQGIQGNREGLTEPTLYVFDVFDIDAQQYMNPGERMNFFSMFLQHLGVQHVPLLCFIDSLPAVTDILRMADGNSINNPVREGIVFKSCDRDFSFKAISDTFLLKGGD